MLEKEAGVGNTSNLCKAIFYDNLSLKKKGMGAELATKITAAFIFCEDDFITYMILKLARQK